jgi:hypothetical protein
VSPAKMAALPGECLIFPFLTCKQHQSFIPWEARTWAAGTSPLIRLVRRLVALSLAAAGNFGWYKEM